MAQTNKGPQGRDTIFWKQACESQLVSHQDSGELCAYPPPVGVQPETGLISLLMGKTQESRLEVNATPERLEDV